MNFPKAMFMARLIICLCNTILFSFTEAQVKPDAITGATKKVIYHSELLLQQYVSVPSVSGHEEDAADFLMEKSRSLGLVIQEMKTPESGVNFCASLYPLDQRKPNIVFLNHIDVVPPGNHEDWKNPPFEATISDRKVYGRGAIDNKGLAVIQLLAIASFVEEAENQDLPYNITMLSVSGEETGGKKGSYQVARNFYDQLNPVVMFGEGGSGIKAAGFIKTDGPIFGISIAERSVLWIELKVEMNTMGHASINTAEYANKSMINGLNNLLSKRQRIQFTPASQIMFYNLGEIEGGVNGFIFKHIDWPIFRPVLRHYVNKEPELASLLSNSYTLSYFGSSQESVNQNAQKSSARIDCRLLPGTDTDKVLSQIRDELGDSAIHIQVLQEGPKPYYTIPENYFVMMAGAIKMIYKNAEVVPILFPASSDNNYFRAKRCPVYGINPHILSDEQIKSIHNIDENIDIAALEKGIDVFKTFIRLAISQKQSGIEFKEFVSNIPVVRESDNLMLPSE